MKEITQFRRTLWELIQLAQLLGGSRELSLTVTALQSARMRLGSVAGELGSETPYPKSDDPKSPEVRPVADVPEIPMDWRQILEAGEIAGGPIANVKFARGAVQELISDLALFRRTKWPRPYGTLGEAIYDLALADAMLAKNWLGEQLAVLDGRPLVKPAARPSAGAQVAKLIAGADTRDLAEVVNALREVLEDVTGGAAGPDVIPLGTPLTIQENISTDFGTIELTRGNPAVFGDAPSLPHLSLGAPRVVSLAEVARDEAGEEAADREAEGKLAPAAALEAGVVKVLGDAAAAGTEPAITPELAGLAASAVDDTIRTHLEAGSPVTEICRVLNVTEHRVNKIKRAIAAEMAERVAPVVKAGARGARIAKELAADKPADAAAAQPETT